MEGKMAGLLRGSAGNCRHKELQTAGLRGARPAACGALVPPCCCSKLGERREQPAPLEIMSRAVRIAARRLSVCLTAVPKSVPNPSAPHGSGAAMAAWSRCAPLLMARGCSSKLGGQLGTQLLPSSRYCSPRIQFCTTEAANFGLPAGVMLAVVMAPTLAAAQKAQ
jgi:hypothetical protein